MYQRVYEDFFATLVLKDGTVELELSRNPLSSSREQTKMAHDLSSPACLEQGALLAILILYVACPALITVGDQPSTSWRPYGGSDPTGWLGQVAPMTRLKNAALTLASAIR